jgi:hypothetical protein
MLPFNVAEVSEIGDGDEVVTVGAETAADVVACGQTEYPPNAAPLLESLNIYAVLSEAFVVAFILYSCSVKYVEGRDIESAGLVACNISPATKIK